MRRTSLPRRCAVPVLMVGVLLAGCGEEDAGPGSDPATSDAGVTAPGTDLTVGETATVPLAKGAGVVEVTVTGIDRGSPKDLTGLEGTPYYVHLDATAVSGDGSRFFAEQYVAAWAGQQRLGFISSPVSVGGCTRAYFKPHPPIGTTVHPCLTFVVKSGPAAADRVAYYNSEDYDIDDDSVITWS